MNTFKVNSKDTRTTPSINFEHISHLVLLFLLLTWAGKSRLGNWQGHDPSVHLKSCQIFIREIFCKNSKRLSAANPLNANPTKWSNTLKQFVGNLPTNCLSVLDHFVGLALRRLSIPAKTIYSKFVTGFQTLRAHVQRTKSVDN